jgi:hypothetical protein
VVVGGGVGFETAVRDAEGLGVTRIAGAIGVGDDTRAGASPAADDDSGAGEAAEETGAGDETGAEDETAAGTAALDKAGADTGATVACLLELVHAASVTRAATAITRRALAELSVGRGMLHADTRSHGAPARRGSATAHVGSGSDHDPMEEDVHGTGCAV